MAITWGIWSQLLYYFLCVTSYGLGVFGPYFLKLPWCSNTHKTGITEPSNDFDIRVRPHLMLNKELKSLDSFFVCPWAQFPQTAPIPDTWETGITQPTETPDTRVLSHLMWNNELKTLLWIAFHVSQHVIWGIQDQFPKINIWRHLKCGVENFVLIFLCVPVFML